MAKKEYSLLYGKGQINFELDGKNLIETLMPQLLASAENEDCLLEKAFVNPVKSPPLPEIISPKDKIAIVINDTTRPTPSCRMLSPLIKQLKLAGAKQKNTSIIFALGVHRKQTPLEQKKLVGDKIYEQYRCIDHEQDSCLYVGETKTGIPIEICKEVADADVRICLGSIEPHYFAGYTGGAKSIMPGVSSPHSVSCTHKLMLLPDSVAGKLEGNPTREAIEEVGEKVGIDFILNVVLDPQKKIVAAYAGHTIAAHRKGCDFANRCFKVSIKEKADVVIVSAGGYPKDMNVYQAQKALDNAKYAVKEGGIIILVAECNEGLGNKIFETWMTEAKSFLEPVERLAKEFVLGAHKAAAIGMLLRKAKVIMVSALPPSEVKKLFFTPAESVDEAISIALQEQGSDASFYIIPAGGMTLPGLQQT